MPLFRFSRRPTYVTCRGRDDGGGAQIAACVSTMIYARLRRATYVHSPLQTVAHAPLGESTEDWSARWENFFSLGYGETQASSLSGIPENTLAKPHRRSPRSGKLNVVAHCHKVTDHHPEAWASIAPELRRKYEVSPKPEPPGFDENFLHIAVHLRRGDVTADGRFSERFSSTDRLLPALRRHFSEERCRLHLYSQGNAEDFPEFAEFDPWLHLDEDAFVSFHGMVTADVLFTAKSTFSYLAGIIGDGEVVYEPFWHPCLPGWKAL
ncbi:conserved hypothetical protein [Haloferula helveola]|uniref:Glycosyl transferase family 11 n=1 Tax=Haloferula helveola TaxID=490095 RepID=A0ABN6HE18_9BACT|nr:conserved hypothetical protein [Haloferula helveola]